MSPSNKIINIVFKTSEKGVIFTLAIFCKLKMTVCHFKKVLTVWNNDCQLVKHKKSPNIRAEGLFRLNVSSIM